MVDFISSYIKIPFRDTLKKHEYKIIFYAYPTYDKKRVEFIEARFISNGGLYLTENKIQQWFNSDLYLFEGYAFTLFNVDNIEEIKTNLLKHWGFKTDPYYGNIL